jgi:hypothetical protein
MLHRFVQFRRNSHIILSVYSFVQCNFYMEMALGTSQLDSLLWFNCVRCINMLSYLWWHNLPRWNKHYHSRNKNPRKLSQQLDYISLLWIPIIHCLHRKSILLHWWRLECYRYCNLLSYSRYHSYVFMKSIMIASASFKLH